MEVKIYACLLGKWVDITNTQTFIGETPIKEWIMRESPIRVDRLDENDLITFKEKISKFPFIDIDYGGLTYSINPIFLQFVR